jgi:DNA-binding beta-propeller fold protein YncE
MYKPIGLITRLISLCLLILPVWVKGQNSVLVNFGSNSCWPPGSPGFSLISNPLQPAPQVLANCSFAAQVPDIYNVFVAYNPSNNKLYIADVRSGTETKIWVLDAGLPGNITCPASIPVTPTYTYSYVANNFEFDKDGTLWAFSDYNGNSGTCNLVRFDVNNGTVISTKVLRFSAGNFPTTISSGDLTILPNGRMFASLGSGVCRLYEIVDYNNAAPEAAANFLQVLPKDCYGIAYLNGRLELAGSDFNGQCYYYNYDISSNILSAQNTFQNAALPIDNASFTPAAGATKKLLSAVKINANTAELVYEIFTKYWQYHFK